MKEKEVNVFCKSTEFEYASHETGCHCVRTTVIEGEPWFVAKDVCDVLGLAHVARSLSKIPDSQKGVQRLNTLGGTQHMSVISESGLYRLVMRSDRPEAEPFIAWVTEEVLPTIRKTGGVYLSPQKTEELLADPDLIIGLAQQVKKLKSERDNAVALRDEAVRTKAHISDKKTATAMGKLGGSRNANRILKEKLEETRMSLGIAENYLKARAIPWIKDYFNIKDKGTWTIVGQWLTRLSVELGCAKKKIADVQYGQVGIYHKMVIEAFRKRLDLDPGMLAKYRRCAV